MWVQLWSNCIPAKKVAPGEEVNFHSANVIDHHEMEDGVCKQEVSKSPFRRHKHEMSFILRIHLDAQTHCEEKDEK